MKQYSFSYSFQTSMTDSKLKPLPKVTPRQLIQRGLKCQCPNCGVAKISKSMLDIEHQCPECGMLIKRGDGYYLGPLCLNYGFVAFVIILPILLLGFSDRISLNLALGASLLCSLLLPVILYRFSWSCWLTIYYVCLPEELHANRADDCDDLSFEEDRRTLEAVELKKL